MCACLRHSHSHSSIHLHMFASSCKGGNQEAHPLQACQGECSHNSSTLTWLTL